MKKLVITFYVSLIVHISLFPVHDDVCLQGPVTTEETSLVRLARELDVNPRMFDGPVGFDDDTLNRGVTSAHVLARALSHLGDMYEIGNSNLSPVEARALRQVHGFTKEVFSLAVFSAPLNNGCSRRAALLGIISTTLSIGYRCWRGYKSLNVQQ